MIDLFIYGFLKKKFFPLANLSDITKIELEFKPNESFENFLKRINVEENELCDCFINGQIAEMNVIIPKNARIGLFGRGMNLLDGGQHLKGHGYVTKSPPIRINTWND